jgi:hypothetical protein
MAEKLKDIQDDLIKASYHWASGKGFDPQKAQELRRRAILLNHRHYFDSIPLYRKIAEEEGCDKESDLQTVKNKMMLSADIFKSYEQNWLDNDDYDRMNNWLSSVFHKTVDADMGNIRTIDGWIEALNKSDIHITYSSGTSGAFSFVPRDKEDWELSRKANVSCLSPLLAKRIAGMGNNLFAD